MDFPQFIEHWAHVYQPMQHTPEPRGRNKRYFTCTGYAGMTDLMVQQQTSRNRLGSPVVVHDNFVPSDIRDNGWEYQDHTLYFAVYNEGIKDTEEGPAIGKATEEAKEHARQFRLYIKKHMRDLQREGIVPEMDSFRIDPYGTRWSGWVFVQVQITVGVAVNQCLDEGLIVECEHFNFIQ